MIAPDLAGIPDFLTSLDRWVAWRNEDRGGKQTKVPKTARNAAATSTAPDTWGPFESVAIALKRRPEQFDGCGIVLGDLGGGEHLCGVDLDSCLDDDGILAEWAKPFAAVLPTYGEVSPSGSGLKFFLRCLADDANAVRDAFGITDPTMWGCKRTIGANGADHGPATEVYLGPGRYFTVTGKQWPPTPDEVALLDRAALLRLAELVPKPKAAAANGSAGADSSRSATAFRKGAALRWAGKTFDEMCAELRSDPDTAAWVSEKGEVQGGRELRRIWKKAEKQRDPALTEDGLALAFTERHRDGLRYCHHTGAWFVWSGTVWRREETKLAFAWAREVCRDAGNGDASLAKAATAAAVERFAQADRAFAVTAETWDRDPFLLGTPGGTVELRSGELRASVQSDFITKLAATKPAQIPECPLWDKFLQDATNRDNELIRFLRQWCGYSLTGSTQEHALLFIYGPGGNGKSVFLNTVFGILGEYAAIAAMDTFTDTGNDRHLAFLAMLKGARMVSASETEEGRAWAEVKIKQLTGGDPITANFMRQNPFTFRPEFKLTIAGNHQPVLRNVDDAARRRFNVVPFTFTPPSPDEGLEVKLHAEWPAILRWMIEGCLDWQKNGLKRPQAVLDATAEYFSEQDTLAQWQEDCCETGKGFQDTAASLFASWRNYAWARSEETGSAKRFSTALLRRGFAPLREVPGHRNQRGFKGLQVRVWQAEADQ